MNTLVRTALSSAISLLADLSRRTISASYRSFLGDDAADAFIGSGAVDRYVTQNLSRCSVLLRDRQIVGFAVCQNNLIDLMMIDICFHRQGLGAKLLQHLEGILQESYEELRLESFEKNEIANAFCRKHGWLEVGRYLATNSGDNKLLFRKAIDAKGELDAAGERGAGVS